MNEYTNCEEYGHNFVDENGNKSSNPRSHLVCSDCSEVIKPDLFDIFAADLWLEYDFVTVCSTIPSS